MLYTLRLVLILSLLFGLPAVASPSDTDATLAIKTKEKTFVYRRAQLLADTRRRTITLYDEIYKRTATFTGIPLRALLAPIPGIQEDASASASFASYDGHVASIPLTLLLGKAPLQSEAYLDVEDPQKPWPKVKGENTGPYRLLWTDAQKSAIKEALWIYSIRQITLTDSIAQRFPALLPSPVQQANARIMHGFQAFQRTCLPCHTLNRAGESQLGPDLNVPYNPIEYLGIARLRAFIRNPQSLRAWPTGKMPPLGPGVLSDDELNDILEYLAHMTTQKLP